MEQKKENEKLYWTQGNPQPLIIPLEQEMMTQQEELVPEPYYPQEGSVITVTLANKWFRQQYSPTLNGNLLTLTDMGTLPVGCYDVEIHITDPDGTPHFSKWSNQIVVTDDNARTLKEWDEFKDQSVEARAAVFFFAKGDPFTYEDFTPEEIEGLQKPARDAAAEITEDYAQVKQDAQTATGAANDAAQNANDKGTYAKNQGDYAKQKADEIEDAKGEYQTLDARLDAMEADTNDRMERITEEELDEIFPLNT